MLTWHEAWCFDCGVLLRKKKQVGGLWCAVLGRRLVVVSVDVLTLKGVCSLGVPDFLTSSYELNWLWALVNVNVNGCSCVG